MAGTPGSFVFTDWVAPECLRLLENMLEMAGYANFSFNAEYDRDFAIGDTVRIKFPQEWVVTDGMEYNPQAINRNFTTATMDNWMQIGFEWDSLEKALKLERSKKEISEQYLNPAMVQMAQECELRFMDFAFFNTPNVVGSLAAIPTAWTTYAQARSLLVKYAGWGASTKRALGVTPDMMQTLITNSLTQFNPTDEISRQYKLGSIGKAAGWDWFESMSCHTHTTGVWNNFTTGVTVNLSGQSGSTINLNCTTGDTFLRGDIITFASSFGVNPRTKRSIGALRQFKIMANATGVASAVTLSIYPSIIGPGSPYQNVTALPLNNDACVSWPGTSFSNGVAKTGTLGIGLNDLNTAMVGAELPNPEEGGNIEIAAHHTDDNTGLSMALVRAFDPLLRRWINRFDMLIGFGPLYADRCGVLVGSLS
jgi:hypothetical protein